nr:ATP-binding protein [Hymenobacter nitidus]
MVVARVLLVLLVLLGLPGRAQHRYWDADYDSLRLVLNRQQTDTTRLRTLVHLLDLTRLDEARERRYALGFLDELLVLNQRVQAFEQAPYRVLRQGAGFWEQGNHNEQALEAVKKAIYLFDQVGRPVPRLLVEVAPLYNRLNQIEERYAFYRDKLAYYRIKGSKENIAACYLSIGGYYRRKGAYNQAISNFLRAAELFRHFDQHYYITELKVAGANYAEWGNSTKALHYLRQSVSLANRYALRGGYGVDAYTLRSISRLYLVQQDTAAARRYATLSLAVRGRASMNEQEDRAYGLVQSGLVLLAMKKGARALPILQEAQRLADSLHLTLMGRRQGEFELTAAWARYYTILGDDGRAEQLWQQAYQEARASKLSVLRKNYLHELSSFYDARNKPGQAQQYSRAYMALADSMSEAQGAYHLAQYEGERMENAQSEQIANLRQAQAVQAVHLHRRNQLLLGALLTIVVVSGLGGLVYWQLRRNKRTLRQLRQTQNQLIASEKWAFVGELSAGIAHELQNPLSFMKKFAEVSSAMLEDMPRQSASSDRLEQEIVAGLKQNLQEISQHGVRASSIIKDMLDHSRAGTGQRAPTNVNSLVEEYLRLAYQGLQSQDKSFRAELVTVLDPALPLVSLVPQDMGRVLLNLFTNAFHAVRQRQRQTDAPYQPTVSIHTRSLPDGTVEIRVGDNGTGMPESVRARVFEPFFTTKSVGEGTGLGLSLSVDIIKAHGGTLQLETQQGQGTEFIVGLPA